jgi:Ran GTPase-activating protein (RanGAP) involved in mRNA processing and transport
MKEGISLTHFNHISMKFDSSFKKLFFLFGATLWQISEMEFKHALFLLSKHQTFVETFWLEEHKFADLEATKMIAQVIKHLSKKQKEKLKLKIDLSLKGDDLRDDQGIGIPGAKQIAEILKTSNVVETLILGGDIFEDQGALEIAKALKTNKSLITLSLHQNSIKDIGSKSVFQALRLNQTLQSLDFSFNCLGTNAAFALADFINCTRMLQELKIFASFIMPYSESFMDIKDDPGVKSLIKAIGKSNSLKNVNMGANKFGDQNIKDLGDFLSKNVSIESITLERCFIGDYGAASFAAALHRNNTLKELLLSNNDIQDYAAGCFADALKLNCTLEILELRSNHIGSKGLQKFADAIHYFKRLKKLDLGENKFSNTKIDTSAKDSLQNYCYGSGLGFWF